MFQRGAPVMVLITVCIALPAAADWPQFRGPRSNCLPDAKNLPVEWSPKKNVRWKVALPGEGWSSPVVADGKVFVTLSIGDAAARAEASADDAPPGRGRRISGRRSTASVYRWAVHCLDLETGETRWKQQAHEGKPRISTHLDNTYASETPVIHGNHVIAYFGMTGLFCYDFNGKPVWKKDLGAYPMRRDWGTSSSPLLGNGIVYLQIDNEEASFLTALDPQSGDERWRVSRSVGSSWSTPILWKNELRTELITVGPMAHAYDPRSGKLLWELTLGGGRSSASAGGDDERLYVGTELRSRGGPDDGGGSLFAVRAGASGDITPKPGATPSSGVVWKQPRGGPAMASPLVYQGYIYVPQRRTGIVSCYDARTGEPAYDRARVPGARGFWASPWGHDGKVFCLDDEGTTHVLRAGKEFEVLGTNELGEQCRATPAIADGALIFRGVEHLFCVKP